MDSNSQDYLDKKIKLLEKFANVNDDKTSLRVEIGKVSEHHQKGDLFRTEFNLEIAGGFYRAVASELNIHTSMDVAIEELLVQLRKHKERRMTMIRRGGAKIKDLVRRFGFGR